MKKRPTALFFVGLLLFAVIIGCFYLFNSGQRVIELGQEGLTIESLVDSLEFDTESGRESIEYENLDKSEIASLVLPHLTPYPGLKYKYIMISRIQPISRSTNDPYPESVTLYRASFRFTDYLESTEYSPNSRWDNFIFDISFDSLNSKYTIYGSKIFIVRETLSDEIKREALSIAETNDDVRTYREANPRSYNEMHYRFTYSNQNEDGSTYINESLGEKIISITLGYPDGPNPCPQRAVVNMDKRTAEFVPCYAV